MVVDIKKKHLIIFGLILLGVIFYIKHYNILTNSEVEVYFKIHKNEKEISFDKTDIILSRIEKPWYYMWMTMQMAEVRPNEEGIVSFRLRKSKSYEVEVLINNKEISCGGIFFDADTLKQGQTVFIPVECKEKYDISKGNWNNLESFSNNDSEYEKPQTSSTSSH